MHTKYPYNIWAVIAALALMTLACGLFVHVTPTVAPTQPPIQLPLQIPTMAAAPTSPPQPTVQDTAVPPPVAEVTATEPTSPLMTDVKDYYQKGYLPFENGEMHDLDDFSKKTSSINAFDFATTRIQSQDFALWADIELKSIGAPTYPNYAGCGFAYRVENNSDGYTAILANDAVRMGACSSGLRQCTLFGTTHGTGLVDTPNQTRTQFSLAVNKDHAWVLVNGMLVGEYSLYTTKLKGMGDLYYAVATNVNAGYMSSCKITNVHVWESEP